MKKAAGFLEKYRSFAISAHANPEGDAIGSILGLAHVLEAMGKKAWAYSQDPVPPNLEFLPGADRVIREVADIPEVEAVVCLDCGDIDRPGTAFREFVRGKPLINIDHHGTNSMFGDINWVDPQASSVGEMIVRLAQEMKADVPAAAAINLYTAILTDTGSFQYSNTTPRALAAAADMIAAGAAPEQAAENYYHSRPASHLKMQALVLATLEFNRDCTMGDVVVTEPMFKETGTGPEAVEGLVNIITDARSARVAVLYRQTGPDKWKVSMRSKGEVDVAAVASRHAGGGHRNAAGFSISGTIDEVKGLVRAEIEKILDSNGG